MASCMFKLDLIALENKIKLVVYDMNPSNLSTISSILLITA